MAEVLFLVDNIEKAEMVISLAGGQIKAMVVSQAPATSAINPQGQGGGAVFSFQPITSVWSPLLQQISACDEVYYCFDTSMVGEYTSYFIDQLLLATTTNVQRHRLHIAGFTEDILRSSMALPEPLGETRCVRHLQDNLFHKVFFSHLGRLLGTTVGPGGVELSIATLTLLSLLVEKHHSLARVVRKQRWGVEVRFEEDGREIAGRLTEIYGVSSDGTLGTGEEAKGVARSVKDVEFALVERFAEDIVFPGPALYTLVDLIHDAYRFYKILPGDVLAGLETLFVGVDTGQGKVGLITSPYGVSTQNVQPVFTALGQFVVETYGEATDIKEGFSDGVILPLNPALQPDNVGLTDDLQHIYELIWSRSVASQMVDAVACDRRVMFEVDGKRIQFNTLTLDRDGFLAVFKYGYETVFSDVSAGLFTAGESVKLTVALPKQLKAQAMGHYQIASLCEDMREMGFVDEKEIISVFQQLIKNKYVTLGGAGEVLCTDVLLKVTRTVDRAFPGMKGLNLSAYYGQTLEEVMSGRKRVDVALKQFDQNLVMQGVPLVKVKIPASLPKSKRKSRNVIKSGKDIGGAVQAVAEGFADFNEDVAEPQVTESLEENGVESPAPVEDVCEVPEETVAVDELATCDVVCPEQDEPEEAPVPAPDPVPELEPEEVACEDSPEDVFSQPLPVLDLTEDSVEVVEVPLVVEDAAPPVALETKGCPECGRDMVVKDDRFGKFWACTGLPACHHSESYQKTDKPEEAHLACPVCKRGTLSINRTSTGKDMYICADSACEFMAWAKPHAIECPLCASPFLVQKEDRAGNISLRCPMAGCSYIHGGEVDTEGDEKPKKKKVLVRRRKKSGSGKKRRVVRRRKK